MPAVPKGETILVTSGSGFIGAWVIEYALRAGYHVRTTVRSAAKGDYLKETFERKHGSGKLEYALVSDMQVQGSFNEAVKGVSAVVHTGSPVDFDPSKNPFETLINPAVNGVTSVFESILAHGSKVQRVVLTSSNAAVSNLDSAPDTVFNVDRDWNTTDPDLVKADPVKYAGSRAYRASKTLSERAAWTFWEKHRPQWDLAAVNPVFVFGPWLQQTTANSLNATTKFQYDLFHGKVSPDEYHTPKGGFVDVRDVADIHVRALATPEAGGQRLPASASTWVWQDFVDALHASKKVPAEVKARVPEGQAGSGKGIIQRHLDGSKAERVLGIKWHTVQDAVDAEAVALADYEKRSWQGFPSIELLNL